MQILYICASHKIRDVRPIRTQLLPLKEKYGEKLKTNNTFAVFFPLNNSIMNHSISPLLKICVVILWAVAEWQRYFSFKNKNRSDFPAW